MTGSGKVYLVGAGPGDPGLITLKGVQCIEKSDVIIYDYLASPLFLKYAPDAAELIYVGKTEGKHTLNQDAINALIAEKARSGRTVTRLKGGDPFIFGRGGEEAEVLSREGITFEIVPGVTSAIAAPAYAGIPLTHREFTSTVAFVTGHEDPSKTSTSIDWQSLARGIGTIVFLMGVKNLPSIVEKLTANGKSKNTPVALIRWGTTNRQVTVSGSLENIVEKVRASGLKAPAIIVVGEVVRLRETIGWFEARPLFGKTVVVTRARSQASDLVDRLASLGAEVIECPTIRILPPENTSALDSAIDRLASYHWIVFTSVNGVEFFFNRLFEKGFDVRALHRINTAAIGPATARSLFKFGLKSDIVPDSFQAESVVEAFRKVSINGRRFLLPRAEEARPVLPVELVKMGAQVDEIIAYRTGQDRSGTDLLVNAFEKGSVDMVTFTSSSTVRNFRSLFAGDEVFEFMKGVTVAAIGPITADTARELGFQVDILADEFTIPGLCRAISTYFRNTAVDSV